MRGRDYWSFVIEHLDPVVDHERILRILVHHEFPWDITQALSFALFRTYAVPSIGRLLYETGEFTNRTQKRYDDTALLLDEVAEHGFSDPGGRAAVRRINQMHGMYAISNDDMRYVLSTFVVMPVRWLADYGWRPMSERERIASTEYYRRLGRHMGIKHIPTSYDEFDRLLDDYERVNFAFDEGGRAVADATLDLMTTFPPNQLLPSRVVRRFAYALMDDHLLEAFRYPRPSAGERALARSALRARARLLTMAPPRMTPQRSADNPNVRGYPRGYRVAELGTFPAVPVEPPLVQPSHLHGGRVDPA